LNEGYSDRREKVYWKKEIVERVSIRIIHNKGIEDCRRVYIKAKGKKTINHHFHAPQ
jgi:hypothetical protein